MKKSAQFSSRGKYRYLLTRKWDEFKQSLVFIMFNPSTATSYTDDATIRKCIGFAKKEGYGGITVVNLFAYRSRHPEALLRIPDPVGPDNDRIICDVLLSHPAIVAAWGTKAPEWFPVRVDRVARMLDGLNTVYCLKRSKRGDPCHPLMLSYKNGL